MAPYDATCIHLFAHRIRACWPARSRFAARGRVAYWAQHQLGRRAAADGVAEETEQPAAGAAGRAHVRGGPGSTTRGGTDILRHRPAQAGAVGAARLREPREIAARCGETRRVAGGGKGGRTGGAGSSSSSEGSSGGAEPSGSSSSASSQLGTRGVVPAAPPKALEVPISDGSSACGARRRPSSSTIRRRPCSSSAEVGRTAGSPRDS